MSRILAKMEPPAWTELMATRAAAQLATADNTVKQVSHLRQRNQAKNQLLFAQYSGFFFHVIAM